MAPRLMLLFKRMYKEAGEHAGFASFSARLLPAVGGSSALQQVVP